MRSVSCQTPEYGEALHQIPNGRWDEDQAVVWNLSLKEVLAGPFPGKLGIRGDFSYPRQVQDWVLRKVSAVKTTSHMTFCHHRVAARQQPVL